MAAHTHTHTHTHTHSRKPSNHMLNLHTLTVTKMCWWCTETHSLPLCFQGTPVAIFKTRRRTSVEPGGAVIVLGFFLCCTFSHVSCQNKAAEKHAAAGGSQLYITGHTTIPPCQHRCVCLNVCVCVGGGVCIIHHTMTSLSILKEC